VPKSTSESQAQITHLLTAPEPAWGNSKCKSTERNSKHWCQPGKIIFLDLSIDSWGKWHHSLYSCSLRLQYPDIMSVMWVGYTTLQRLHPF